MPSTVGGNESSTCQNFNKDIPYVRTHASMHTSATSQLMIFFWDPSKTLSLYTYASGSNGYVFFPNSLVSVENDFFIINS